MCRLLYKFASRGRSKAFFETLDNIHGLAQHDDFVIVSSHDLDDPVMCSDSVKERMKQYPKLIPNWGHSRTKIEAINSNMDAVTDWDILVVVSDDQMFLVPGFDKIIIEQFEKWFPDKMGSIHFPDAYGKHELITMSMMNKKLYDFFGYIYHPDYISLYCDNHFTACVRVLNCYAFCPTTIYSHNHPAYNTAISKDALYVRNSNPNVDATDNLTYHRHRAVNFGLY